MIRCFGGGRAVKAPPCFAKPSLERRTKARPAYKGVTQSHARVDVPSSWGAEDTPSDEEKIEEMMCEEMGEALVGSSQDLAVALSGYKDPESIKGWD